MAVVEDEWLEEHDMTGNEAHNALGFWFGPAIASVLPEPSVVIWDIFMLEPGDTPVATDLLVSLRATPANRPSWRLDRDPVPDVTIEILSPSNRTGDGFAKLERKRQFFGKIGVPEHIELDPEAATIDVWVSRGNELVRVATNLRSFISTRLYGVVFEAGPDGGLQLRQPDGEIFPLPIDAYRQLRASQTELLRSQAEIARMRAALAAAGLSAEEETEF